MHVGILAAIILDRRPVAVELFIDGAVLLFPEAGFENLGHIGQHGIGQRMTDDLGGGGGEKHEGVAVPLLGGVGRAVVVHLPEVATMLLVAVLVP